MYKVFDIIPKAQEEILKSLFTIENKYDMNDMTVRNTEIICRPGTTDKIVYSFDNENINTITRSELTAYSININKDTTIKANKIIVSDNYEKNISITGYMAKNQVFNINNIKSIYLIHTDSIESMYEFTTNGVRHHKYKIRKDMRWPNNAIKDDTNTE